MHISFYALYVMLCCMCMICCDICFSLYIHIMSIMHVYALIFTFHANELNYVLAFNLSLLQCRLWTWFAWTCTNIHFWRCRFMPIKYFKKPHLFYILEVAFQSPKRRRLKQSRPLVVSMINGDTSLLWITNILQR